jgi:hypothetical protein
MHLGDSVSILHSLLPKLIGKPVLFYLDAHGNGAWPLLGEIAEIGKTHKDNCIIVIDDFKVPGRDDIPYDYYKGNECSYEYIKNQLDEVFTEYAFTYLIPKRLSSRAKFVALPKKWLEITFK